MGAGGPPHRYLTAIRQLYPLSFHGVGLSLGSADGISQAHLTALKHLLNRYEPAQFSEHLAWSRHGNTYVNDLLPVPYTHESLSVLCANIDRAQSFLGCRLLLENPSSYIDYRDTDFAEPEFLNLISRQSGCGLLLDVNNVFVSATNNGFDPYTYLEQIDASLVGEIHLAGHSLVELPHGQRLHLDDHGSAVRDDVWLLYRHLLKRLPQPVPVMIEWDTNVPALSVLLAEAQKADAINQNHREHR